MGPTLDCGRFCKLKKKQLFINLETIFYKKTLFTRSDVIKLFFFQNEYSINPQLIIQIISIIK
jgi:hypothetical protein